MYCVSTGLQNKAELQQLLMVRCSQLGTGDDLDRLKTLLRLLISKEGHHLSGGLAAEGPSQASVAAAAARRVDLRRYKTELCRSFAETGHCRYGAKCQFAHGMEELRPLARHPRYRTELCHSFHVTGFCPYGSRCNFIHGENISGSPGIGDASVTAEAPLRAGVIPAGGVSSMLTTTTTAPVLMTGRADDQMLEQLVKQSDNARQRAICGRMCHGNAGSCGFI